MEAMPALPDAETLLAARQCIELGMHYFAGDAAAMERTFKEMDASAGLPMAVGLWVNALAMLAVISGQPPDALLASLGINIALSEFA